MTRLTSLLIAAIVGIMTIQAQTKDYRIKVGDFTELTVAHNVNVNYCYSTDSAGYASYTCSKEYASVLTFNNNNGKMKIEVITDKDVKGKLPVVTIYSSELSKATNLGDSTLCLLSTHPSVSLSLKVIGNGDLKAFDVHTTKLSAAVEAGSGHVFISGNAQEAKFTLASVGAIEAGGLKATKVKCWMFGTGSIDCSPEESLSVFGATSGTVYYTGNPTIKKRTIGAKLIKVDD